MKRGAEPATAAIACALLTIAACSSAPSLPYVSDECAGVGPEDLAPVVVLSAPGGGAGVGSAVAVAPSRLLTARHVIEPLRAGRERFPLRIGFATVNARLVAAAADGAPHGDWALVEVDAASWSPAAVAALHAPALAPEWQPAPGAELIFAGYGTGFFPASGVDPRVPAPIVVSRARAGSGASDPLGAACFAEGRGMDLAGMSGGAVFVRNEAAARLELIGIFVGQTSVRDTLEGPFGIRLGAARVDSLRFVRVPREVLDR